MDNIIIGSGAPAYYDYINSYNSALAPSELHASNTGLQRYFARYLLQKAISVNKWKMPKIWSKNYFLYVLYCWGYLAIVNTDKFGVIPQACGLRGYDVFYQPTSAIISNPLLSGNREPRIGSQCVLFKLQPDYGGIMDLVNYYADLMALCAETTAVNLVNSKLSYVFGVDNKQGAESFKKMLDQIASGKPGVFVDKNLFNEDGSPAWFTFAQDLKGSYIASDILSDMRKIETMFDTDIGIPNANTDKKERLITSEVEANDFEVKSKCALWLDQLKQSCEEVREMFGIDISVDWREEGRKSAKNGGDDDVID